MTGRSCLALVVAFAALTPGLAQAQSDTQDFTVTVASQLTITAPTAVTIAHDATDANQAFAAQSWDVTSNAAAGAAVTFAVAAPFTHTVTPSYQADAKLDLALATSDAAASWSVTSPTGQTDYANAVPVTTAQVGASSSAAGNATFNLTVTFVDSDFSQLATGSYAVTVTGTVTAN